MNINFQNIPKILYKQFCEREGRIPKQNLEIEKFYETDIFNSSETKFVWFGHSAIFIRIDNKNILIDPMFGSDTSPIAPFKTKRFSENTLELIDKLPQIDLILISHDHYDHLDLSSIEKLKSKTREFYVALGTERHLVKWGIDSSIIKEFDWWDSKDFEGLNITFTPTRHFSGRGLTDRAKSLWGGWVIENHDQKIWFSGDSGYGKHFKEIGERLGPFDFAFMENGQYNENWHLIHMFPEESIQASIDANVKKSMPVHWAGFPLSLHTWKEPIERFTKEANEKKVNYITPKIGEVFSIDSKSNEKWWDNYK
jgi:L-ascorbate metabolism protein UlaG (beta-lactamase superfamily)